MQNIKIPVFLTTAVLVFYTMTPFIGVPYALISTIFLLINGMLIWMVIRVLKDGVPSGKKFEDRWYDDIPSPRPIEMVIEPSNRPQ